MASIPVPRGHPAIKLLNNRATDCDGFITHLDRSPVRTKIMVFQVPFWSNMVLGGLLAWRTIRGSSQYSTLFFILYGDFVMKQNTTMSWTWTIINLAIDLFLYKLVWPGVRKFVTGHLWLRLRWGFRETEIVFRKPTGWRRALLNGLPPEELHRQSTEILYRAIDAKLVSLNTGYLTRSDYWVLEYGAVGDAYSLVAKGEVDIKTWDLSVWTREGGEWEVWEIWRLHDQEAMGAVIAIMTEKLKSMGKEDLIEQWTSMRTSGAPATIESINAVVDLFRSHGINFEELWTDTVREVIPRAAA